MEPRILSLRNPIKRYAWGSRTALAELLARSPSGEPEAELWIGAHAGDPSCTEDGERLDTVIAREPEAMLGADAVAAHGAELSFLLKIIAVAQPLSLQVHPDHAQAAAGYLREEGAGIARNDPRRSYLDPRGKPELVLALARFSLIAGFRADAAPTREELVARIRGLFADDPEQVRARNRALAGQGSWVGTLATAFPDDPAVAVAALMHEIVLEPGQALFMPPGCPHAYLEGLGVEIMANSDNTIRAGLTVKHCALDHFFAVTDFAPGSGPLRPARHDSADGNTRFVGRGREFELSDLRPRPTWTAPARRGADVLLGLEGTCSIEGMGTEATLAPGHAVFVPAAAGTYRVRGEGSHLVRATTPID